MKILSITDIITNSSSEVFTIVHPEDVDKIKQVINTILEIAGSDKTSDDLFDIEYYWDKDELAKYMKEYDIPTKEEAIENCKQTIYEYREATFVYPRIKITCKQENNCKNIHWLDFLTEMFASQETLYC